MNPMSALKPDIEVFRKANPNNFGHVEINGKKVSYAWAGNRNKRPVIFVHGSPGSWDGWVRYLNNEALNDQFHLISIDRFGYGGSEKGKTEKTLSGQAEAIKAVLTINTSLKSAILVGHSYGGPVIARAAMEYPAEIGGLVFIASSVDPELEKTKWIQYPATWWPIRVLIPSVLRVCNEEIMALKKELILHESRWRKITAKSVVIQGLADKLVPAGNADYLVQNLEKSVVISVKKVEDSGHFIIWDKPQLIINEIIELNRVLEKESEKRST